MNSIMLVVIPPNPKNPLTEVPISRNKFDVCNEEIWAICDCTVEFRDFERLFKAETINCAFCNWFEIEVV
jgi:hypothetical protein